MRQRIADTLRLIAWCIAPPRHSTGGMIRGDHVQTRLVPGELILTRDDVIGRARRP